MPPQLTPEQQQAQLIAAKERERIDNSRFASNLVYSRLAEQQQQQSQQQGRMTPVQYDRTERQAKTSLVTPRAEGEPEETPRAYKRPVQANIDSAIGQPYLVYEGSVLDTVLMNRLDGDAAGPVKVLVSNPLYSHDHQHVIIPEGTVILGEAKKIGAAGFGQQRRLAVVFHRLIMPDGYSVDLDQFRGLDQIGEEGVKVAGASEITQGGSTITTSGSQAFTNGTAASVSQSATSILDRFLQIPPTITGSKSWANSGNSDLTGTQAKSTALRPTVLELSRLLFRRNACLPNLRFARSGVAQCSTYATINRCSNHGACGCFSHKLTSVPWLPRSRLRGDLPEARFWIVSGLPTIQELSPGSSKEQPNT
jgi:type IV secretory pathway VirB10-like protein